MNARFGTPNLTSRTTTGLLAASTLVIVLCAIGLACTDAAGRWGVAAFDGLFLRFLGTSDGTYWSVRFIAEKSIHVALFTGLAMTLWASFKRARHRTIYVVATGFALGCCSELFQRIFPTRDPSIRDVLINWSAVIIGVAASHGVCAFLKSINLQRAVIQSADASSTRDLLALEIHVRSNVVDRGLEREMAPFAEVAVANDPNARR